MNETDCPSVQANNPQDPAERIVEHLLRAPSDLIDTRHLMRRFRASVDDVLRALHRLETVALKVSDSVAS